MRSPTTALIWEIWQRGRRSIWLVSGCVFLSAFVNLGFVDRLSTDTTRAHFHPFFGMLMVLSFLLLMGIFNYTEFSSTKEWHGFPYRLFVLPIRTWRLVALPMLLGVVSVELVYVAWIKLVWTHQQIVAPGWFAVVLGAYVIFYQTTLWTLAGVRIMRLVVLSFGGVSSIAVACLPMFSFKNPSMWLSEKRLIPIVTGLALVAFVIAWASVGGQRCGGGRRQSWVKSLLNQITDAVPKRRRQFSSATAAQFWFEWRRTGWLLPACMAFVLLAIIAPISWFNRSDPRYTNYILGRLVFLPLVLAFVIGKGFIKPEFWSANLSLPTFLAVKPLASGGFVVSKMKAAALSVAIAWLFVVGFIALWLPLWANTADMKPFIIQLRLLYPHSWQAIVMLFFIGFMVVTWRCLVTGLWVGLSGSRSLYIASMCVPVIVPSLMLLAYGIWSDSIEEQIRRHPDPIISVLLSAIGWTLALAAIFKLWLAVFSWKTITPRRSWQYLLIWLVATLAFVALGILSCPPFDTYRQEHLYVLAAFLVFPLARLGLAPASLARNRHR